MKQEFIVIVQKRTRTHIRIVMFWCVHHSKLTPFFHCLRFYRIAFYVYMQSYSALVVRAHAIPTGTHTHNGNVYVRLNGRQASKKGHLIVDIVGIIWIEHKQFCCYYITLFHLCVCRRRRHRHRLQLLLLLLLVSPRCLLLPSAAGEHIDWANRINIVESQKKSEQQQQQQRQHLHTHFKLFKSYAVPCFAINTCNSCVGICIFICVMMIIIILIISSVIFLRSLMCVLWTKNRLYVLLNECQFSGTDFS